MLVSCSGHRSSKLFGTWKVPNPKWNKLSNWVRNYIEKTQPDEFIVGGAQGWDELCANVCATIGMPFTLAVPFFGQEKMWPEEAQKRYHLIASYAKEVVIVSPGEYSKEKMHARNCWMVDRLVNPEKDHLLSAWDGTKGGTSHCVRYAFDQEKKIYRINPQTWEEGWMTEYKPTQ